jgi:hypothetical protein
MITAPLNTFASVVLNSSGNGQVSLGPTATGETWQVTSIAVATNQGANNVTNDAQCAIYLGAIATVGQLIDTTLTGSSGDQTDSAASVGDIFVGQVVTAVWTGGDTGASATMSIFGTRNIPG